MKKILLILCLLPIAVSALSQKSFNDAQLKLRSDIEVFLREEGFMPTIDKDGDIVKSVFYNSIYQHIML